MTGKTGLQMKLDNLTKQDVCIAFSGGADSSLLLKMAVQAAKKNHTQVWAVTVSTRLLPAADVETAQKVAKECQAEHFVLELDESGEERILENSKERCYWCKRYLFLSLKQWAAGKGIETILEGSNLDDLGMYRPGLRAVRELGVESPLAECRITKREVRRLAEELGISVAKRPAAPCMATRFPYGVRLDFEVMRRLEEGERKLQDMGFDVVRARLHGEVIRVELPGERLSEAIGRRDEIVGCMRSLGFHYITLDMEGFRSGSMDLW